VVANPNPRAPLVAMLRFKASEPVATTVEIDDGRSSRRVSFPRGASADADLPLLGLRAGTQYQFHVTIADARGRATNAPRAAAYSTPPLPSGPYEFPPYRVLRADTSKIEPGVTLLSIRRRIPARAIDYTPIQQKFTTDWGIIVALDERGDVVWYYLSAERISGIERLRNGNILYNTEDASSAEVDMLGNIVRRYYARDRWQGPMPGAMPLDARSLHHLPAEMPNGNFLLFTADSRVVEDHFLNEYDPNLPRGKRTVVGDTLVEIDRSTGARVWSWNAFDHLDVHRIGFTDGAYWWTRGFPGAFDWTHGNGLGYDARDDSVIFSLRNQDAIFKVDRKTGDIRWILGENTDWGALTSKVLKPVGEPFRMIYRMHNPRLTSKGTVVVFDNGSNQARPPRHPIPPNEAWSRGVEYEIDEKAMTVRQVWASASEAGKDPCHSFAMSDAHRLPVTDNMLVIFGVCSDRRPRTTLSDLEIGPDSIPVSVLPQYALVREYTRTNPAQLVFEARFQDPQQVFQWQIYGGEKTPTLYPSIWATELPPDRQ
jgi:hypothetical protein